MMLTSEGTLLFNYHSIYSTPWASSAELEAQHLQLSQVPILSFLVQQPLNKQTADFWLLFNFIIDWTPIHENNHLKLP